MEPLFLNFYLFQLKLGQEIFNPWKFIKKYQISSINQTTLFALKINTFTIKAP